MQISWGLPHSMRRCARGSRQSTVLQTREAGAGTCVRIAHPINLSNRLWEIRMSANEAAPSGPDFCIGVLLAEIPATGVLAGHVDGAAVLLVQLDDRLFAVDGACTHYGAPLVEGRFADGVVHCPWHHACFNLRTGAVLTAPAFASLATWRVDIEGDRVFVREKADAGLTARAETAPAVVPTRIVIVGGGAAGFAAAEKLRALGYEGTLTVLSDDADAPCDRPNLSKDFLAGRASEDWIPLQSAAFYRDSKIDLHLGCEVVGIDTVARSVETRSGQRFAYDRLLLATGAEPVRMPVPGFDLPNVFALRTLADARAIIERVGAARTVVMIGAGFISLEAAAALRTRGLEVHVVAREEIPMARVLGSELGSAITRLHQQHGVVFHFERSAQGFDGQTVTLDDGSTISADFVIVGIGVKPRMELARNAGLSVRDGVLVDAQLRTSVDGIFAAGDVARFPYAMDSSRIEHWVVAQRQGQVAASSMLGLASAFDAVPFFWTHHYDLELRYVGHATSWDDIRLDGSIEERDCTVRFYQGGSLLAAACIGRDLECLQIEAELASLRARH